MRTVDGVPIQERKTRHLDLTLASEVREYYLLFLLLSALTLDSSDFGNCSVTC